MQFEQGLLLITSLNLPGGQFSQTPPTWPCPIPQFVSILCLCLCPLPFIISGAASSESAKGSALTAARKHKSKTANHPTDMPLMLNRFVEFRTMNVFLLATWSAPHPPPFPCVSGWAVRLRGKAEVASSELRKFFGPVRITEPPVVTCCCVEASHESKVGGF